MGAGSLKIINDPVYGFITVDHPLILELIRHPFYQRMRRIQQMGFANLVYPGAVHTRLHHSLGAYHLMCNALSVLKGKGTAISEEEELGAKMAILLHDVGHGPFSHALENNLIENLDHESVSLQIMQLLNSEMQGDLSVAIAIFTNMYPKKFLHQLVSGQLDVDRMDYLNRDSFFTGVSEGVIGYDRIIHMLTVFDGELMVQEKGIYSIEKFLVARRLMYWQVYLHKTVIAAEQLLAKILRRSRELALSGKTLFATPALNHFLANTISKDDFINKGDHIEIFANLDDTDIMAAVKVWVNCSDPILARLCRMLMQRDLYHVDITNKPPDKQLISELAGNAQRKYLITKEQTHYFVFADTIKNNAYRPGDGSIRILMKDGTIQDITLASDNSNLEALAKTVKKYILCYTKDLL